MKSVKFYSLLIGLISPFVLFAQALLESADGEELLQNPMGVTGSSLIGNFNVSEQSAQFRATFVLPHKGILPDQYLTFGLKGKPTNGISTLFSGGKMDMGTNINLGYTKINIFSGMMSQFTDYITLKANFNVNKYTIFDPEDEFKDQFQNINFRGGGVSINYNNLVAGKNLFTISAGYLFKNNFLSLPTVEIRDFKSIYDKETEINREYGSTISSRIGDFKKYHSIPLHVAYTRTPSEFKDEQEDIKFGFSTYYLAELSNYNSAHHIGAILFLTKLNSETGIRIPVIGLGIQVNDITGKISSQEKFKERISLNLTTAFNIAGF